MIIFNKKPSFCWVFYLEANVEINSVAINPNFLNLGIFLDGKNLPKQFFFQIDLGILQFNKIGPNKWKLTQVHLANSLNLHPIVSWSGVLWSRQAALQAHQSLSSYLQGLNQID